MGEFAGNESLAEYDYNGNHWIDFGDVVWLFRNISLFSFRRSSPAVVATKDQDCVFDEAGACARTKPAECRGRRSHGLSILE